jgi:hypothetical protein
VTGPIDDAVWQEMDRFRNLAAEMGDTDPLQLAVEAIQRYRDSLAALRQDRDVLRQQLLKYTWPT